MSYENPIQPSDIYPALTWARLIILARIAFERRKWVFDNATPERGDDVQLIGFRAWKHTVFEYTRAAAHELADWLSVKEAAPHFVLKVRMMPIRFCRGDGDENIPENYEPDAEERAQFELALGSEDVPQFKGCLRVLVEHDGAGAPVAVRFALADLQGAVTMSWTIPRDDDASGASPIVVPQTPVKLPDLEIQTIAEAVAAKEAAERTAAVESERSKKKGA